MRNSLFLIIGALATAAAFSVKPETKPAIVQSAEAAPQAEAATVERNPVCPADCQCDKCKCTGEADNCNKPEQPTDRKTTIPANYSKPKDAPKKPAAPKVPQQSAAQSCGPNGCGNGGGWFRRGLFGRRR